MASSKPHLSVRAYVAFALLAVAFAATVVWAIAADRGTEWRRTEARFHALERRVRPASRGESVTGVQQIWLPDLARADRCTTCHRGIDDPSYRGAAPPFGAHPQRWLETHPPDRFGCTACHGGQGEATTYAGAGHRPIPHWPTPMRPAALIEAGCGTCHRERAPASAPALAAGRTVIAQSGCAGCHDIPGFRAEEAQAPRLESVGAKVRPEWLARYLKQPQAALPGARMPDFRLTTAEIAALSAFLSTQQAVTLLDSAGVDWSRADADRGRELFARARCVTCHRVDERGGTMGPDLSSIGTRVTRRWLWSYLSDPHRDQPDTRMPHFRFAPDEVRDITEYLVRDLVEPDTATAADVDGESRASATVSAARTAAATPVRAPASLVEDGRRAFVRRGCFGCHRFTGMTAIAKIGPSLRGIGDRPIERADFLRERVTPTLANWLLLKLRAPQRMTNTASLMPTFAMDDRTRVGTVVALLSLSNQDLPASRVTSDAPIRSYSPQGAFGAIVSRYRCLSCHQVGGFGGDLSTVALDRIGSQLQPAYLKAFMLAPSTVRVHLEARMPKMNLTVAEAGTVVDHAGRVFVDDELEAWSEPEAGARDRGHELYDTLGCAACHSMRGHGGYVGPDLSNTGGRLKPGWVQAWLRAPDTWRPGTLQPDYGLSAADAQALAAYLMTFTSKGGSPAGLVGVSTVSSHAASGRVTR